MAEKTVHSRTSLSALKKLEEQLTCAICLDLYTNPKILPCFHSFCQQCLERLPLDPQGDNYISCPTCRRHTQLPEPTGATGFPAAFHINNLKEVHNLMTKVSGHQQVTCDICTTTNATVYCKECKMFFCDKCIDIHKKFPTNTNHMVINIDEIATSTTSQLLPMKQEINCPNHNKPLEIFCETCEGLICQHCTVRIHRDHDYDLVSDCYPKHCQKLKTSLKPVSDKITAVANVLTVLTDRKNEIKKQGEVVIEEIHVMVEEIVNFLRQSELQLTREVDTITGIKLHVLSEQTKSAEMKLSQLKDCQKFVEQSLEVGSRQQVLSSTKQMMERMSHVTQQVNIEEFSPREKADISFIKDNNIDTLRHLGDVVFYSPTVLQQCKVKKIEHDHITITNKMVSFPLCIQVSDSCLLSVPLSSLNCSIAPVDTEEKEEKEVKEEDEEKEEKEEKATHIATSVTATNHPGVYIIRCSCVNYGRHHVNVSINNVQVDSTSVVIPFNSYLDNITPIRTIPGLNDPWGVAVTDDGHIIVSETNAHCVTILDRNGKKVRSFGQKVAISYPRGVTITSDNFIIVVDNHKIHKISMDGKCIAAIGKQGSGPLEFSSPWGIAISPVTGHIYIADGGNNRIQVLNSDLTFAYTFGTKGSASGQFNLPYGLAFDRRGLLYVTDHRNHCILTFNEGQFLSQIGKEGSGPGQLYYPTGIAIDDNDLLYVAEYENHRISIFNTNGQFVRSFGGCGSNPGKFNCPRNMIFAKRSLYVCDRNNKRLIVY